MKQIDLLKNSFLRVVGSKRNENSTSPKLMMFSSVSNRLLFGYDHVIYDSNGFQTDKAKSDYYDSKYAWDNVFNRAFCLIVSYGYIGYRTIDQTTGQIGETKLKSISGSYDSLTAMCISMDGSKLLLGDGNIFNTSSLDIMGGYHTRSLMGNG